VSPLIVAASVIKASFVKMETPDVSLLRLTYLQRNARAHPTPPHEYVYIVASPALSAFRYRNKLAAAFRNIRRHRDFMNTYRQLVATRGSLQSENKGFHQIKQNCIVRSR